MVPRCARKKHIHFPFNRVKSLLQPGSWARARVCVCARARERTGEALNIKTSALSLLESGALRNNIFLAEIYSANKNSPLVLLRLTLAHAKSSKSESAKNRGVGCYRQTPSRSRVGSNLYHGILNHQREETITRELLRKGWNQENLDLWYSRTR